MSSKNIQEYIAEQVIKHMEYRDEEVRKLEELLEKYDVILCGFCGDYGDYEETCEVCELKSCKRCSHFITRLYVNNISLKMFMCDECANKHYCFESDELKITSTKKLNE